MEEQIIHDVHWLMFWCFWSGFLMAISIFLMKPKRKKRKNDCAADGCTEKNVGGGKQMCAIHEKMYEDRKPFKAFYGKTVLKRKDGSNL